MLNFERVKWPEAGKYVLAVSGGADSMVLLDLMAREATARGYELTVAHYDHGIREDSARDRELVELEATGLGLEFIFDEGLLGVTASESLARRKRHEFLRAAAVARAARLVTAHHQDDLLETSLLNLARGTGRRGLAPMLGDGDIERPLIELTKAELLAYARHHGLDWHEDATNADETNPRNFLRRRLLSRADAGWRARYLALVARVAGLNRRIDADLARLVDFPRDRSEAVIPLAPASSLSLEELAEAILFAARGLRPDTELSSRVLKAAALFAKRCRAGQKVPLNKNIWLRARRNELVLMLATGTK